MDTRVPKLPGTGPQHVDELPNHILTSNMFITESEGAATVN